MSATSFHIESTPDTPEVRFSASDAVFEINGRSLPEDAFSFFKPLIEWAEKFEQNDLKQTLVLRFRLDYFNSASSRYILEFLATLEKRYVDETKAHVEWYVDREDEIMIEKGEEFKALLCLPLDIRFN